MFYLDTSLLVSATMQEQGSEDVRLWLAAQRPDDLAVSDWVITEFSSALAIKMRTRAINADQRALALTAFSAMLKRSVSMLPVGKDHFHTAARYCDVATSNLRAADALHVAVAATNSAIICTRDDVLAKAGPLFGVETRFF